MQTDEFRVACLEVFRKVSNPNGKNTFKSTIVESKEEIIKLSNRSYDCQSLGMENGL